MDAVEKDVRLLVKKELRAANQKFPMFHSAHEAGIPTANFPFKTMMFINEEDGVVVRDGYGATPVKI